jgi:N6-adenosine-specific RNA methylase IME4
VFHDLQKDPKKPTRSHPGRREPTEFYKLAAKLIPTELKGELTHNHKVPGVAVVACCLGCQKAGLSYCGTGYRWAYSAQN